MKKYVSIILVIIWMAVIFILSSFDATTSSNQSGFIVNIISNIFNISNVEMLTVIIRKAAHFMEYLILGILIYNMHIHLNKSAFWGVFVCFLYAFSDEIHQVFVDGRSFQTMDILIDTIGSIIGIYFTKKIYK